MLTTTHKKIIPFVYIDDKGYIKSKSYVIDYNINPVNFLDTLNNVIDSYSNNLNVIKGLSNYNNLSDWAIETPAFRIKVTNNTLTHNVCFMSYLGSITDVVKNSISHQTSTLLNMSGNNGSVYINIKPLDASVLINATKRGIKIGAYKFDITHDNSIDTIIAKQARQNLNDVILSLSDFVLYNEQHIDKDFFVDGDCIMDTRINLFDNDSISDTLLTDLSPIIKDAAVKDIIVSDI